MTTRAGPTSTSHKMLASTCVLRRLRTSVTCLRNKFTFGVDTPRSVGRDIFYSDFELFVVGTMSALSIFAVLCILFSGLAVGKC